MIDVRQLGRDTCYGTERKHPSQWRFAIRRYRRARGWGLKYSDCSQFFRRLAHQWYVHFLSMYLHKISHYHKPYDVRGNVKINYI